MEDRPSGRRTTVARTVTQAMEGMGATGATVADMEVTAEDMEAITRPRSTDRIRHTATVAATMAAMAAMAEVTVEAGVVVMATTITTTVIDGNVDGS
jgi:hypothetical protein